MPVKDILTPEQRALVEAEVEKAHRGEPSICTLCPTGAYTPPSDIIVRTGETGNRRFHGHTRGAGRLWNEMFYWGRRELNHNPVNQVFSSTHIAVDRRLTSGYLEELG